MKENIMTDLGNTPAGVPEVVADPKKPWKALAGFVLTFLALVLQAINGGDDKFTVNEWLVIIIGSIVAAGGVYLVPNPKVLKR
jgi:hypothetical protein